MISLCEYICYESFKRKLDYTVLPQCKTYFSYSNSSHYDLLVPFYHIALEFDGIHHSSYSRLKLDIKKNNIANTFNYDVIRLRPYDIMSSDELVSTCKCYYYDDKDKTYNSIFDIIEEILEIEFKNKITFTYEERFEIIESYKYIDSSIYISHVDKDWLRNYDRLVFNYSKYKNFSNISKSLQMFKYNNELRLSLEKRKGGYLTNEQVSLLNDIGIYEKV